MLYTMLNIYSIFYTEPEIYNKSLLTFKKKIFKNERKFKIA